MSATRTVSHGWAPPNDARTLTSLLIDDLRRTIEARDFVATLQRSAELSRWTRAAPGPSAILRELTALAEHGPIARLAALESIAAVQDDAADQLLIDALSGSEPLARRHATWHLARRTPHQGAVAALLRQLVAGGIDTMHAHRTLRRWAETEPAMIKRPAEIALSTETGCQARARIGDLLSALDLGSLSQSSVADAERSSRGLRIAQIVLAPGLDGALSRGGRGDTGGVASLLVSLGEHLAARDDVDHVVTIGRGDLDDAIRGPVTSRDGELTYATITVGDRHRPAESANDAWEHLPGIERDIRRALRDARPLDVVHLRMADVGTLAAASVAAELRLPVCFSLAPDPHHLVHSLQTSGELDEASFVQLDADAHIWFRARLVEQLAAESDRIALFPGSRATGLIDEPTTRHHGQRRAVIAEGVDVALARRAATRQRAAAFGASTAQVEVSTGVLDELARRIPTSRRELPIVLSVGRLNPVKGMERVVAAWANDDVLQRTSNLVIVGGALDQPSRVERQVLDAIDRALPPTDSRRAGLVMLGGRPRGDIAHLLASVASGRHGSWAPGGVYVDGALKEEFGLAVLEALAAGLVVVAPSTGGPSSYVENGDTGVLVHPGDALETAIRGAFTLVDRPGRADRARTMVESSYSIETMAAKLVALYA